MIELVVLGFIAMGVHRINQKLDKLPTGKSLW